MLTKLLYFLSDIFKLFTYFDTPHLNEETLNTTLQ